MVHTFEMDNSYYAYDVESGSCFEISRLAKAVIDEMNGKKVVDYSGFYESEINQARKETQEIVKQGYLFSKPANITNINTYSEEIKALCLHICHDCNLRCEYCFAGDGKYHGKSETMTKEVGFNAIDFLIGASGKRNNLEVDFFGGEPLMNFDVVKQIVDYAKEKVAKAGKTIKFTMTTNGLLLNDDAIEYLNEEMDNVVISIDGRKEVHDEVRKTANGKGSYDIALKNAKKFRAVRGDKSYYIRGTFTAKNLDFCQDVLSINDCGFDQISVEPVVLPEQSRLAIKKTDIEKINEEYEKLTVEYVERRKTDKWFNFFHFFIDLKDGPCLTKRLKGCGAGNEYLAITPNGDIYPCHQFAGISEYIMGNVFEKNINDEIKMRFASSNLLTKPDCQNCFAKYFCSGGCAANNINFNGDINKPFEISCEMMRKRLECALFAYAKENCEQD